jgi:hypothetical protein
MAKTRTWKDPKSGTTLVVGQLIHINAATRLGPASVGTFIITGFTDEGIKCKPTQDYGYGVQEIRVQPEDITSIGPKPYFTRL